MGKTIGQLGKTSSESIMKVRITNNSKRDEFHETPLALQSNCEAIRTPSTRETRFAKRQARANEEQASHEKVNTARASELRPSHDTDATTNKNVSLWPNVQVLL